jgi:phosphoenolpyruvate carboxykinase (GTP)
MAINHQEKIEEIVLDQENLEKLKALNNEYVLETVVKFIRVCKPSKVTVITDDQKDRDYILQRTKDLNEEMKLKMEGHTYHKDSQKDLARDKKNTRVLIEEGEKLSKVINTKERSEGIKEIMEIMDGAMRDKEMFVLFFSLGPTNSRFSFCALQVTDSAYVAHSEILLYRPGYEEFKRLNGSPNFFYFVHSAGEVKDGVSINIDKRRIYIDRKKKRVLSVNNTYAGNSVGLKKLALRLAICVASDEGWLAEHMLIMGVSAPGQDRVTYFLGAFPSASGKTSTAMINGFTIVGDDIAYIRMGEDGYARAANIEHGIFGIIKDVNEEDDYVIFTALTTPREIIFSNVLIEDGVPRWLGDGRKPPEKGFNYAGAWEKDKKDEEGNEILFAHPNARYTLGLEELENCDPALHDPNGVPVSGIFYGGRDSDTSVPIYESFNWEHGVFAGAILESETTSATLDEQGVLKPNPMANIDFLVIPLGNYLKEHFEFGRRLKHCPKIFATNYFLKKDGSGEYLNKTVDKKIWILWSEGRVHGDYDAIQSPVGYIPKYEDLKELFNVVFGRTYTHEDYVEQFAIRIDKWLKKLDRIEKMYKQEEEGGEIPEFFWNQLTAQRNRLLEAKEKYNKDIIFPFLLE